MAPPLKNVFTRILNFLVLYLNISEGWCTQNLEKNSSKSLKLVNLVYRHGSRSPMEIYPTDPYQVESWPRGLSQLTLNGTRQHYELGQWLRQRYVNYQSFLNPSYLPEEVYVRSTDWDRTLMSAQANLAGLFPPSADQTLNAQLLWQPIPIHTVPQKQDWLLLQSTFPCPAYDELVRKSMKSDRYKTLEKSNQDFFHMVQNHSSVDYEITVANIWRIRDAFLCELYDNRTWPDWDMDLTKVYDQMTLLEEYQIYTELSSIRKARLSGGLLPAKMIDNMKKKINHSNNDTLKLYMYSGHDTTLSHSMAALGVYNGIIPPFAACFILELWQDEFSGNWTVEMWYKNESRSSAYRLSLPTCSPECPFDLFYELAKTGLPTDLEVECIDQANFFLGLGLLIGICIGGILALVLFIILIIRWMKSTKQPSSYNSVNWEEGDIPEGGNTRNSIPEN